MAKENTFLVVEEDLRRLLIREFDLPEDSTISSAGRDLITGKFIVTLDIDK